MFWRLCVILFVGALLEWKSTQCAPAEVGKAKEKVRAYEFGYSVEENQHRHEKRDENGIVMGEFGFITADGIYHVTVYATDENGKFKILAMKSYPYGNPENKIMVAMLPPPKKPVVVPTIRKGTPLDTPSCSGCVLTKKLSPADVVEKVPEDPEAVFRPLSKSFNDAAVTAKNVPSFIDSKGTPSLPSRPLVPPKLPSLPSLPSLPLKPNAIGSIPSGTTKNGNEYPLTNFRQAGLPTAQISANRQGKAFSPNTVQQLDIRVGSTPTQPNQFTSTAPQFQTNPPSLGGAFSRPSQMPVFPSNTFQAQQPPRNTFTPNTATAISQNAKDPTSFQPLNKFLPNGGGPRPSLNSITPSTQNTIQPLSKNTLLQQTVPSSNALTQPQLINNNYTPMGIQLQNTNGARTPTQQSQLPSTGKLTPAAPTVQLIGKTTPSGSSGGPLYRFKYVLDYNSHREEGRIDGSKEGNYHTVEDGIRRIIDYIANENGYQPHIKWERIPPNELPTGENKLKEYEFVWFNTP